MWRIYILFESDSYKCIGSTDIFELIGFSGEYPNRIFVIGGMGVDRIKNTKLLKKDNLIKSALAALFSAITIGALTYLTYKTPLGLFLIASFGVFIATRSNK